MKIRKATEKDYGVFAELTEKNHSYIVGVDKWKMMKVGTGYKKLAAQNYIEDVKMHDGVILVAETKNKIIGCAVATLSVSSELIKTKYKKEYLKTGFIKNVFVEETFRGQGIGSKIVGELEKYLKEKGCPTVHLEVFAPNTNALKIYNNIGYQDHSRILIKIL
ncbi:MAG: GNAT family N-acetyltransferase [bacterium]|nr:GNAT family N-acetyltransferase [bacterium]